MDDSVERCRRALFGPLLFYRREVEMRIKPLFAWYDIWIGVFIDTKKSKIYILPLPCIGVVISFNH